MVPGGLLKTVPPSPTIHFAAFLFNQSARGERLCHFQSDGEKDRAHFSCAYGGLCEYQSRNRSFCRLGYKSEPEPLLKP
ncbi:Uncharacterised protein [uncultured archaeon]|nr:Uncharacterised protein [uncultured archaeon]